MLNQISAKNLTVEKEIGKGGYGIVYTGKWHKTPVAIKKLLLTNPSEAALIEFKKEAEIMAQCQHPNVVRFYGACLEPGEYALVMDYVAKGSLYHVLHNPQEKLPWSQGWDIGEKIGLGLHYLHEQKIIHRDFKSLNVLLDENYHPKITDFGLSKIKLETTTSTTKTTTGSIRWQAPELFKRKAVATFASDIYSYGMVLWEIASRKDPFEDASNELTAITWIQQGEQETIPDDTPKAYGDIIQQCWQTAEKRPTAYDITLLFEKHKPQPENSNITQPEKEKSWHYDRNYTPAKNEYFVDASEQDKQKVTTFYQRHPVSNYEIKSVKVLINPDLNRQFSLRMKLLQERKNNPVFNPKWPEEKNEQREKVHQLSQTLSASYQDPDYPDVKLLPLWHATSPTALEGILKTGYANLATTDSGFFGKGIYSAWEAEYSHHVYFKGSLLLNWVCYYSAYPVVDGDMSELMGKGNYANYDAHFVPVHPASSNFNESAYYPCKPHQTHQYIEVVVFESSQCLPRYLVELQPTLTKSLSSKIEIPEFSPKAPKPTIPMIESTDKKPSEILFKIEPPKIPEIKPHSTSMEISKAPLSEEAAVFLEETTNLLNAHDWTELQKKYFSEILDYLSFNDPNLKNELESKIKSLSFNKAQIKPKTNYTFFKQNAHLHANRYRSNQTLTGHTRSVCALTALTSDTFASGSKDKTVKIWRYNPTTKTYICTQTLSDHASSVYTLTALTSDVFASGSSDKTIKIWRYNSNIHVYTYDQTLTGHASTVRTLAALTSDTFASGADDKTIKIWRYNSTKQTYICTQTMTGHTGPVNTLTALTPDIFASGSDDETIKIWRYNSTTQTYICAQTLTGHTHWVRALTSLTSDTFASGSSNKTIKIWRYDAIKQTYSCIQTLTDNTSNTDLLTAVVTDTFTNLSNNNNINALTGLTPDTFASGSYGNTIKIWRYNPPTQTYTCTQTVIRSSNGLLNILDSIFLHVLTPLTSDTFASGCSDNTITIWRPTLKPTLEELEEKAPECKMM